MSSFLFKRRRRSPRSYRPLGILFLSVLVGIAAWLQPPSVSQQDLALLECSFPPITDGDTFRCGGERVRLQGIDAPELGECRRGRKCVEGDPHKSRDYLQSLTRGAVQCRMIERDSYGRVIGRCTSKGIDLSCAMIEAGHAVHRYARIRC